MPTLTQRLQSQTGFTVTRDAYSDGAFLNYSTTPWDRSLLLGESRCHTFHLSDDYILMHDVALRNAGWRMARSFDIEDQLCINVVRDIRWTLNPYPVEIVSLTTVPTAQGILDRIYQDDHDRASSEKLIATIEDVYQLLGHKIFREIDLVLESIDLEKAAPEYSVGLLRTTSKDIRHIGMWQPFLTKVTHDLARRKLDPKKILIGLV